MPCREEEAQQAAADVDGSGSVDMLDVLLIYQYFRGLINVFPLTQ